MFKSHSFNDQLDGMPFTDLKPHTVQVKITAKAIKKFFDGQLIESMANPSIDLPEAAIDHFDCRDNINAITRLYTAAAKYLHNKYNCVRQVKVA